MPVLSLPSSKPASLSDCESECDAGSLMRPNDVVSRPMWVSPPRNVPVATTIDLQGMTSPWSAEATSVKDVVGAEERRTDS